MPYKEKEIEKLYYTIGEVADMFQVNKSLLRFWETEFSSLRPKKASKGNRLYTKSDIELIGKIKILVKENGFTIEGAKKQLKEKQEITITHHVNIYNGLEKENIAQELNTLRQFLVDLKNKIEA